MKKFFAIVGLIIGLLFYGVNAKFARGYYGVLPWGINMSVKMAEAQGISVPQGGTYIPLAPVFGQGFLLKNDTGKDAYDITLTWCDEKKRPYGGSGISSYKDADKNGKGVMTESTDKEKANGTNNPIRYKCEKGKQLKAGATLTIDLDFPSVPYGTDLLYTVFTDPNGDVVRTRIETSAANLKNNSKEGSLNLGAGDYFAAIDDKADVDYYSFRVVDDNAIVNLSVTGSGTAGVLLLELFSEKLTLIDSSASDVSSDDRTATEKKMEMRSAESRASLSILGGIKAGKYFVRVSGTPQNYLIKQSTTTAEAKTAEEECPEDDSGSLDIGGTYGMTVDEIVVPVRIQSAPNAIFSFGFEVIYNSGILQYLGFAPGNLTGSGDSFEMFNVNLVASGKLRIGGASTTAIPAGTSGSVILLKFKVISDADAGCWPLTLERLKDDIAKFSQSGGCFCLRDTKPPLISCPENIIIPQTSLAGASANNPAVLKFLREPRGWDLERNLLASDYVGDHSIRREEIPAGWNLGEEVEVFYAFVNEAEKTSPLFSKPSLTTTFFPSFDTFLKIDIPDICLGQSDGKSLIFLPTQPLRDLEKLAPLVLDYQQSQQMDIVERYYPWASSSLEVSENFKSWGIAVMARNRAGDPVPGAEIYIEQEPYIEDYQKPKPKSFLSSASGLTGWFGKTILSPGPNNVLFATRDKAGNISSCAATITVQPMECVEDDSGQLDIPETAGRIGEEILISARIQSAPNAILDFSFETTYNPDVLEYARFERGDLMPSSVFPFCEVNSFVPGELLVAGSASSQGIPSGASGNLIFLKFKVIGEMDGHCYSLGLENLAADVAQFSKSGGCFCVSACNGDQNGDGEWTPADSLIIFRCYLETGPCNECSDVDGNSEVTPADSLCVFKKYLDQPSCLDTLVPKAAAAGPRSGFAVGGFSLSRTKSH